MGNRPGFLKGAGERQVTTTGGCYISSPNSASFKKPEIFTAKEAIMNRTVERQVKELDAGYSTTAVPSSQKSQIEEYISRLESTTAEVENKLAELRHRLSPLLLPEVATLNKDKDNCMQLPSMSEATYRIHSTVERLENLYSSIGDVLSRL